MELVRAVDRPAAASRSSGERCACRDASTTALVSGAFLSGLNRILYSCSRIGAGQARRQSRRPRPPPAPPAACARCRAGPLDGLLGRLLELAAAEAPEVVRRAEEASSIAACCWPPARGRRVLARQRGEAEVLGRREFWEPGRGRPRPPAAAPRRGTVPARLLEAQHRLRRLDLDALARVELDL